MLVPSADVEATFRSRPEVVACDAGALRDRLELRPRKRRMADAQAELAIGPGDHVLTPDELRVASDPVGNELRMFDVVAAVTDHARDDNRTLRQRVVFEHMPLVFVHGVRGFDRKPAGAYAKHDVEDMLQRDIVWCGPWKLPQQTWSWIFSIGISRNAWLSASTRISVYFRYSARLMSGYICHASGRSGSSI